MNSISHNVLQFPARPIAPPCPEPETEIHPLACTAIYIGGALAGWTIVAVIVGCLL